MAKYQLKLNRETCQSNFVCTAVYPGHFKEENSGPFEGKASLVGESEEDRIQTINVEESDKEEAQQAANGCPMLAIELIDEESDQTIAP